MLLPVCAYNQSLLGILRFLMGRGAEGLASEELDSTAITPVESNLNISNYPSGASYKPIDQRSRREPKNEMQPNTTTHGRTPSDMASWILRGDSPSARAITAVT